MTATATDEGTLLLVDKPYKWTSFDVVRKIRNKLKIKKVGHAGTLDPLATGLLIVCTGKMTKKINEFQDMEKEYEGELVLGQTTPSYDLETLVNQEFDISHITETDLYNAAANLPGHLMQAPPVFSAVKIDGERAYKKARRGEEVEIKAKEIFVREFEITSINLPTISFRISCSKGTYIRSLVRDFGEGLQAGAYMSALRRTKIGGFEVKNALTMEQWVTKVSNEGI